jgi:hypothetical protein
LELSESAFIRSITSNGGAGGDIVINVGTLKLNSGGGISSVSTSIDDLSGGAAGDVIVTATESVTLDGAAGGISAITLSGSGTGGRLSIATPSSHWTTGHWWSPAWHGCRRRRDRRGSLTLANGATFRAIRLLLGRCCDGNGG